MIGIIVAFSGVLIAVVGLFMNYIHRIKKVQENDITHINTRLDDLVDEISDLKERVARAEESITRIDKKVNNINTLSR